MNDTKSFKARSSEERSGDVLVSFSSKWRAPLVDGSIGCVFRRRYPKSFIPKRMFVYIAAPYSEVIGVFIIKNLTAVKLDDALTMTSTSHVSEDETKKYFEGYQTVGCYVIEPTKLFNKPITLEQVRKTWAFYPPQSFVTLSMSASNWFDDRKIATQ